MTSEGFKRKITAILSADVEGYSRLMGDNEEATVQTLTTYREVMTTLIHQHSGKVLDSPGDNLLAEFASVVDAVQCAVAVQKEINSRNTGLAEDRRMQFRIGINLGDVIQEEDRIYGDGVNIAARLEGLADPSGICISKTAFDHIESKLPYGYEFIGDKTVKNIAKPVGAYRVLMEPRVTVAGKPKEKKPAPVRRTPILVGAAAVLVLAVAVGIWQFYTRRPPLEPASLEKMAFALPKKPSIAVLPFVNMSKDTEQDFFSDAISENIISTLSRIPDLFVIARNSTFFYKGKPITIKQVSEDLGVRYVLEGSVLKSGNRLRISAQLIDALKGHHLWTETYDRDEKDLFSIIDEISLTIAKALSVKLMPFGLEAGENLAGTKSLEAWLLYVKGYHLLLRGSKEDTTKSRELFEQAVEIDPNFAIAWTYVAYAHFTEARYGYSSSRTKSFNQAKKLAQKSLDMDDTLNATHSLLADMYLYQRKYDEALDEFEKALKFDPNDPWAYWYLGRAQLFIGQPDKSIPLFKKAMRLQPHYHWAIPLVLGKAYFHSRRYEDAIDIFEQILESCKKGNCNPYLAHLFLSAIYIELGQEEEGRSHMQKVLENYPDFNLEDRGKASLYKDPAMNERELDAHRKAGAPENPPSQ